MNALHCQHIRSVEELRAQASAWDDLWQRGEAASPEARAELLAQWLECFQSRGGFHAIVVTDRGRWLAALPLVACRVGWVIPAGGLPCNPWASCGELLLDRDADVDAVLDAMLGAIAELSWPMLWFNETSLESFRWQSFVEACKRAGVVATQHERFRVGRVKIASDWDAYEKRLPKNHRQAMRRALRRLNAEGDVQFEMQPRMPVEDVEPWLCAAFDLEDIGWKGEAGTSVRRSPGMYRFYVNQAEQLAKWGQLETASLRLDGRMVAFLYGFRAKGVCFANKIGYDPDFAEFSPGQLLFHHALQQFSRSGDVRTLDFMGPLNQSLSRWRPDTYGVGRIVLTPQRWLGRTTMYAYEHWWRPLRDWEAAAEARLRERAKTAAVENTVAPESPKDGGQLP